MTRYRSACAICGLLLRVNMRNQAGEGRFPSDGAACALTRTHTSPESTQHLCRFSYRDEYALTRPSPSRLGGLGLGNQALHSSSNPPSRPAAARMRIRAPPTRGLRLKPPRARLGGADPSLGVPTPSRTSQPESDVPHTAEATVTAPRNLGSTGALATCWAVTRCVGLGV